MHRLELSFRPRTQDELVIREVLFRNEYHLPDRFESTDRIVDIGSHIGMFAVACLERGAKRLWCYEPDPDNFAHLDRNLTRGWRRWSSIDNRESIDDPPSIQIHKLAVWRNDWLGTIAFSRGSEINTAMGFALTEEEAAKVPGVVEVDAIPFDRVIFNATEGWKYPVRLCKIDAEGAEWPMLEDSQTLRHIDELLIEIHMEQKVLLDDEAIVKRSITRERLNSLTAKLEEAGLHVEHLKFGEEDEFKMPFIRARRDTMPFEVVKEAPIIREGLTCTVTHGSSVPV